jgi:hypothetical protein
MELLTHFVQTRDRWQALANAQNLTNREPVSFSRTAPWSKKVSKYVLTYFVQAPKFSKAHSAKYTKQWIAVHYVN